MEKRESLLKIALIEVIDATVQLFNSLFIYLIIKIQCTK